MTRDQVELLLRFIEERCQEAEHFAIHRSGSNKNSEFSKELLLATLDQEEKA